MATTWPSVIDQLYTSIEAITPTINATTLFRRIELDESIDRLPDVHDERRFFIRTGGSEQASDKYTFVSLSINRTFEVVVSYDTDLQQRTVEKRVGSDEELIMSTLLKESSRVSGQNWIAYNGSAIERTDDNRIILTMSFITEYDISYSY